MPPRIGCRSLSHFMCIFPAGAGGHNENGFKYVSRKVLISQRVNAAQLTPGATENPTIPFPLPPPLMGFLKAIPTRRGENPAGTKGSADAVASCTEHKEIEPKRLDCALWG